MTGQNEPAKNILQFVCLSFAVLCTELLTDLCLKISQFLGCSGGYAALNTFSG